MTIATIILAHYKERENNLKRIIDDLMGGTKKPDKILLFIDNPNIQFEDSRVIVIRSSQSFLPNIRFALGSVCDTDYCFFLDDDLSVQKRTLENFWHYTLTHPDMILGLEGSALGNTQTPYTNDIPVKRGTHVSPVPVDIIIRTYFVPTKCLMAGLLLRTEFSDLPKTSLDDIFLCLGNKYINNKNNYVIPIHEEDDVVELSDGGVGQERNGDHYKNRNLVCRFLMNRYL